jgi:hypothetical protein
MLTSGWNFLRELLCLIAMTKVRCTFSNSKKSLYCLKQASLNWFEKLKLGLTDRGFTPLAIHPCLYMEKNMVALTYVDDCIIVGTSMKSVDAFIYSMQQEEENFILTDEGSFNKFLGIEIT